MTSTEAASSGGASSDLVKGFSTFLRLQVLSRIFTFVFNLLVIRKLRPEDNGLSVQFHLITTTVLFVSREGFRRGCLRAKPGAVKLSESAELERISGVSVLPVVLGSILCALVCGTLVRRNENAGDSVYAQAVLLHVIAIFLELMSEPFYIIAHVWVRFRRKLWVEGSATFARCSVTAALLYITDWRPEYCFSAAQIAFGAATLLGYGTLLPEILAKAGGRTLKNFCHFDPGVLQLSLSFLAQSIVKLIMTEGSNYVLVAVESRYSQGVFGLVSGLGSLVVRMVFQPIEEAAFLAFSRAGIAKDDATGLRKLNSLLTSLVRAVSLIGMLAVVFGPPNSATLLRILYSEKWSSTEAPTVLGWYCGYILLLAVNGVAEAFVHAVLDARSLFSSNAWMVGMAAIHMSASAMLSLKYGSVGLILADGVGMCLRISFSIWCIREYFPKHAISFTQVLPSRKTLLALAAAAWISWFLHIWIVVSDMEFITSACIQVIVALGSAAGVLFVMYKCERTAWETVLTSTSSAKKTE